MLSSMSAQERGFDRATRRAQRQLQTLADELQRQRLATGLSQRQIAEAARIPRSSVSRLETGKRPLASVLEISRVAGALGLDLVLRVYPGGDPLRDTAQVQRLERLVSALRSPLTYRTEVPLPASNDRFELRAWDAMIGGEGRRTAIEVEMRIRDGQALERRLALKRRDDPTDGFLLVLADTRTNRRALVAHPDLFAGLPRLRRESVLTAVGKGQHPPSGVVLL